MGASIHVLVTPAGKQDIYPGIAHRREKGKARGKTALGSGDSTDIVMLAANGDTRRNIVHGGRVCDRWGKKIRSGGRSKGNQKRKQLGQQEHSPA